MPITSTVCMHLVVPGATCILLLLDTHHIAMTLILSICIIHLQMLHLAGHQFDMLDSVLVRVEELLNNRTPTS